MTIPGSYLYLSLTSDGLFPIHRPLPSGADDIADCTCNRGYTGPDGQNCTACEADSYKVDIHACAQKTRTHHILIVLCACMHARERTHEHRPKMWYDSAFVHVRVYACLRVHNILPSIILEISNAHGCRVTCVLTHVHVRTCVRVCMCVHVRVFVPGI